MELRPYRPQDADALAQIYFDAVRIGAAPKYSAAALAAMPFKSAPDEAAVGDVFGTFPVDVAVMRTRSNAMPKTSATTCATFK